MPEYYGQLDVYTDHCVLIFINRKNGRMRRFDLRLSHLQDIIIKDSLKNEPVNRKIIPKYYINRRLKREKSKHEREKL